LPPLEKVRADVVLSIIGPAMVSEPPLGEFQVAVPKQFTSQERVELDAFMVIVLPLASSIEPPDTPEETDVLALKIMPDAVTELTVTAAGVVKSATFPVAVHEVFGFQFAEVSQAPLGPPFHV
jgi:hypothetical protein